MANPIGVTFVPNDEQSLMGRKNLANAGGIPEAIKFIRLQIPKFAGARAIAPDALLQSPGGGGQAASVVDQILRSMGIGGGQPGGLGELLDGAVNPPLGGQPGTAPPPRVRPIDPPIGPPGGIPPIIPPPRRPRRPRPGPGGGTAPPPRVGPIEPRPPGGPMPPNTINRPDDWNPPTPPPPAPSEPVPPDRSSRWPDKYDFYNSPWGGEQY